MRTFLARSTNYENSFSFEAKMPIHHWTDGNESAFYFCNTYLCKGESYYIWNIYVI